MFKFSTLLFAVILALALMMPAFAAEQNLSFADKRHVNYFEKDYKRYARYFENIKSANIEELKGFIAKLEKRLTPISANGKTHAEVKARYEKIEALKKKIGETTEGDGQAPKPPEAKKAPPVAGAKPLGFADKRHVSYFDKDYKRYKGDLDRLDPSRYDHLKKLLANLHKRLDPISAAARAHPEVQKRKKILAELQARFG